MSKKPKMKSLKDWLKNKLVSLLAILPWKEWIAIAISVIALSISLIAFWYPYSLSKRLAHLHIDPEIKTLFNLNKDGNNPILTISNVGNIPAVTVSVNYQVFVLNKENGNIESASSGKGIYDPRIFFSEQIKPSEHPELRLLGYKAPNRLVVYEFNLKYFRESDMQEYSRKIYYFIDNNEVLNRDQFKKSALYPDVMADIASFSFEQEPNQLTKQPHLKSEPIEVFFPKAIPGYSFKIIKSGNTTFVPGSGDRFLLPKEVQGKIKEADNAIEKENYQDANKIFSEVVKFGCGSVVYSNWCEVLKKLARETKDAIEANNLFKDACDKCKKATEIKPDADYAYNNWGNALAEWAEIKQNAESEGMFSEACEKFKKAIEIKPDDYSTYRDWGFALANWAKRKEGTESDKLFMDANEKYRKAIEIKPDYDEAYNSWGFTLADWARRKEGPESDRLFNEVFEKYRKTIVIKSDRYDTYCNWGHALTDLARRKDGADSNRLFNEAFEKYKKADEIKPDLYEVYQNWGNALYDFAQRKEGIESDKLFTAACEKYKKVSDLKPDRYENYYVWGNMLWYWSERKNGKEKEGLLTEACEKYQKIVEIQPDIYEVYNNWGASLSELADGKEGEDGNKLFNEACYKWKKVIEIKPDSYEAYKNWSLTLLKWAYKKEGKERNKLFNDAVLVLIKLEELKRGAGAYNLAYLYGLNDENECQKWLKIAEEEKTLPERQEAMTNPAFVNVRDKQWFRDIHWQGE
jgi:tetratricopeptide (TPR) repeat protein